MKNNFEWVPTSKRGVGICDEQHRCMGLNSHGVSKVSVIDAAGVKQVEHK